MLMPIGTFAKASRLSVKVLRNYDESGLLPAAYIDPQTSYRYYRIEQLARADAIRSLRMVAMPLPQIVETLDGDDPDSVLMSHLDALLKKRDEIDQMATQMRRRINTKEFVMSNEITLKHNEASTVAAYRTETSYSEIFNAIPAGFDTVIGSLAEAGLDPAGIPFTLYYQAPDAETLGDIAMCVPVSRDVSIDSNGVTMLDIEAETAAVVVHKGSYDNMGESYATVVAWIQERGHAMVGPAREVYLNSLAEVDEADLLTEIHFPIDAEGQG